jgi:hypothetical protein
MADINFGILDTQAPGRFAAVPQQQEAQQAQNALQLMQLQHSVGQNELAKYQLSSAKRADTEAEQLRSLYGGASATGMTDPEFIRRVYAVNPAQGRALEDALAKRATEGLTQKNLTSQIRARDLESQYKAAEHAKENFGNLAAIPGGATDADIDAVVKDAAKSLGMQSAFALGEKLKQVPLADRNLAFGSLALKADKRLELLSSKPMVVGGQVLQGNQNAPGFMGTLAQVTAAPSTEAAMLSARAAGMKYNPSQLGFQNVLAGGGAPPPSGLPVNQLMPMGAPATTMPISQPMPTAAPSSRLTPAAQQEVNVATAKAQIPHYDATAGGFVTPPTASNPKGTFVPLTAVQDAKDVEANRKALKISGYDHTTGKDEIAGLINKSTGGVLQAGAAGTLGAFNYTTEGADAIARLGTRVKAMTLSLLNGKLGAGISNADRDFIEGQFGDIANPNLPSDKRLAAWDEAKKRMLSLGMLDSPDQPKPAAAAPAIAPTDLNRQALDWAAANPNDPRAARIRQRNGVK